MDYRNLAEEELKLRIAEQFFPTYDCAHRIGKIDFTGAKGARPVRATSEQRGDHTGDTLCRVADGPKGGLSVVKDRRKRSSKAPWNKRFVIYTQFRHSLYPSLCLGLRIGEGADVVCDFVLTFFLTTCFIFRLMMWL